jgi:hypothetical protein
LFIISGSVYTSLSAVANVLTPQNSVRVAVAHQRNNHMFL